MNVKKEKIASMLKIPEKENLIYSIALSLRKRKRRKKYDKRYNNNNILPDNAINNSRQFYKGGL